MRITARLDAQLLAQAKTHAAACGMTLTAVPWQALRESLGYRALQAKGRRARLESLRGSVVWADADLDNSASLLGLMDA